MDKKLIETQGATNLCVEIMNSRRQAKEKLGLVVQKRVNVILYLSIVLQKNRLFVFNGDFLIELFSQKDKLHLIKGIYFLYLYVQ